MQLAYILLLVCITFTLWVYLKKVQCTALLVRVHTIQNELNLEVVLLTEHHKKKKSL